MNQIEAILHFDGKEYLVGNIIHVKMREGAQATGIIQAMFTAGAIFLRSGSQMVKLNVGDIASIRRVG